jgi:hypothetical protein
MEAANTLAYYDAATITTVNSFIVPVPAVETYDKDLRKRFEKK